MYEMLLIPLMILSSVDTWSFFDGVEEDDSFEYDVCDSLFYDSYTAHRGRCYAVSIDIQSIIHTNEKIFYLVLASTVHHEKLDDRVLLIDGTDYTIHYIFLQDRDYAESIQNTIFWRNWGDTINTTHGASTINLQENDDSTALIISERTIAENGQIQHVALYKNFETSYFTINDAISMPISAEIFTDGTTDDTTIPVFSFEMTGTIDNSEFDVSNELSYPEIVNSHHEVEWR